MTTGQACGILPYLRQAALRRGDTGPSDGELLEHFRSRQDEAAFEALLHRHGPMILGVCRRLLGNSADAEDAFQATFLVLLRKARSIDPPQMVGNFLYGVAYHTARRARQGIARRHVKENEVRAMARPAAEEKVEADLLALLDQELHALPDKYRLAIIICELEGKTRKEAAKQLGCAEGTVASRLDRGRRMLAGRLRRRGVVLSAVGLAAVLSPWTAQAGVPPLLAVSTIKAVFRVAAGETASAALSAEISALAEGVLKSMFMNKLKWIGVCVLILSLLGAGVSGFAYRGRAVAQSPPPAPARAPKTAKPAPPPQAPVLAKRLLKDALEAARSIEDKQWKAWMLTEIAQTQADQGDKKAAADTFKEALEAAQEIDGFAKFHTTHQIAGHMARTGDIEGARKVSEAIEHDDSRDYGLMEVAAAQAHGGDIKGALATAETIATERHKSAALRVVVEVHAKAQRLKEASKLAETIAEEYDRALALVAIGEGQARAKDRVASRKSLADAVKIADGIDEEKDGGAVAYACVAKAQAEMGDVEQALKTAQAIKKEVWKDNALRDVAAVQIRAGKLQEALKTSESIPGAYVKGEAMKALVDAHLRAGDRQAARKTAESIDNVAWRVQALLEIGKTQAKAGDRADAAKTFQKAREEVENVQDEEPGMRNIRNAIMAFIVKAQAEAGEEKKAVEWATQQTSPLLKTQALLGIAQGLAASKGGQEKSRK